MSDVDICPALPFLSCCTGGGGLDIAAELAIPGAGAVCYVERDAFACEHLVSAIEARCLGRAPVWSDIKTFNGRSWRGRIFGLTAGYPCQPFSIAGRRRGVTDPRHLWPSIRRVAVQSRAVVLLLENVAEHLNIGFDAVHRELRRLGFSVEAGLFTASETGAKQGRKRLFILAVADWWDGRLADAGDGLVPFSRREEKARAGPRPAGADMADANSQPGSAEPEFEYEKQPGESGQGGGALADASNAGLQGRERAGAHGPLDRLPASGPTPELCRTSVADTDRRQPEGRGTGRAKEAGGRAHAEPSGSGAVMADATGDARRLYAGQGREGRGEALAGGAGDGPGLHPPGPGDMYAWADIAGAFPDLLPSLSRHDKFRLALGAAGLDPNGAYGAPQGMDEGDYQAIFQETVESTLRGMADDVAPRVDQLRMLGNGVHPLQAAFAYRTLVARLSQRGSAGATELAVMMGVSA